MFLSGEWVNKLWCIQTIQYYSALKTTTTTTTKTELSSLKKPWRKLKCILLSERSQFEKTMYSMIPTTRHSGKDKSMKAIKRSAVARG